MASALVAALHYLALAVGLSAVYLRGRALRRLPDPAAFRALFRADGVWAFAAFLWLTTGPARAFGPLEKGSAFYLGSKLFLVKMALFAVIFLLEIWPMITYIRWRKLVKNRAVPDLAPVNALTVLNNIQLILVVITVFVASLMARGF